MASELATFDADIILNVVKRRDSFRLVSQSNRSNVNIAYLAGQEITSDAILTAKDLSGTLIPNWAIEDLDYEQFTAQTKIIRYYHFLITDVFVNITGSTTTKPLFWKHTPQRLVSQLIKDTTMADSPNVEYLDIKILDRNMNEYEHPEISYDLDEGVVYFNLENNYNYQTGQWNLYFVRYAIQFTDDTGQRITQVYHDLLAPQSIYHEATSDDLNPDFSLKSNVKAYLITENAGYLEIELPSSQKYAIQPLKDNKLQLNLPTGKAVDVPWFVTISNGRVLYPSGGDFFIYDVPEYLTKQEFDPFPPFKYIQLEKVKRIKKTLYKLSKKGVVLPGVTDAVGADAEMHASFYAYDAANTLKEIFTTDMTLLGKEDSDTGLRWNMVLGLDPRTGIAQLDAELPTTYTVYGTYYYEEDNYEMTDIDLNPSTNNEVLENAYVFYLVPQGTDYGTAGREASCYFLTVDKNGVIQATTQDGTEGNPTPSGWVGMAYRTWKEQYTLAEPTNTYGGKYLILAEVNITSNQHVRDLEQIDIRRDGGGIREDALESLFGAW